MRLLLFSFSLCLCAICFAREPQLSADEATRLEALQRLSEENPAAAADQLREALTPESSLALRYALAAFQYQADRPEAAIATLRQVLTEAPAFSRARRLLAGLHYHQSDHAAALPHLQRLILQAPEAQDWRMLAWSLLALEHPLAAETAIRQALLHQPADSQLQRALLQSLLAQGREAEALPLLRRQLAADPAQPDLWRIRVNQALRRGDVDAAIRHLRAMQSLDLADSTALLHLGDLLLEQELLPPALAAYQAAEATAPGAAPERLLRAAQSLLALDRRAEARELLNRIDADALPAALRPQALAAQAALADDPATAAERYAEAVEAAPADGHLLLQAAPALAAADRPREARQLYQRAIRLGQPFAWHAHLGLARLDIQAGDTPAAIRHLEQALDLQPSAAIARYLQSLRHPR